MTENYPRNSQVPFHCGCLSPVSAPMADGQSHLQPIPGWRHYAVLRLPYAIPAM